MIKKVFVFVGLILFFGGLSLSARAELSSALKERGWDEIVFDDLVPNSFSSGADYVPGSEAIDLVSESSVSVAFLDLDIDIEATPILTWEWLARNPDPNTDTKKKGDDDRTITLYIAFPYQAEHARLGERFERVAIEALKGSDTPGRVLFYSWGGGAERGERFASPYTKQYGQVTMLNLPGDALNVWHRHRINLRQDFIEAFGYPPANPSFLAISSDSDDTATQMRVSIRGLRFIKGE